MLETFAVIGCRAYKRHQRRNERRKLHLDDTSDEAYSPDRVNRRVVLAELVCEVYNAAKSLSQNRENAVWEHKGYVKVPLTELVDDKTVQQSDVVGVFRKTSRSKTCVGSTETSAHHDIVVALRGTMLDHPQDLMDDLKHAFEVLHSCEQMKLVKNVVENAIRKYGVDSVCITGHSLGAGVALLVAREFAERMVRLETHLFNPPFLPLQTIVEKLLMFSSIPLILLHNWLKEHLSVSQKIELWRSDSKELLVEMLGAKVDVVGEKFKVLSEWRPHFYLNRSDMICSGYIEYFESDIQMFQSKGGHNMSKSAAPFLKKLLKLDASAQNLIPSANLVISDKGLVTLISHKLTQWQDETLDVEHIPFKDYELEVEEFNFVGTCLSS